MIWYYLTRPQFFRRYIPWMYLEYIVDRGRGCYVKIGMFLSCKIEICHWNQFSSSKMELFQIYKTGNSVQQGKYKY